MKREIRVSAEITGLRRIIVLQISFFSVSTWSKMTVFSGHSLVIQFLFGHPKIGLVGSEKEVLAES